MVRPQNPEGTDGGTVGDISGDQSTVAVYAVFVATRSTRVFYSVAVYAVFVATRSTRVFYTVAVYAVFVATRPPELQHVYFTGWGGGGVSLGGGPQQGPAMSRCYSRGATFSSQFNLAWPPPFPAHPAQRHEPLAGCIALCSLYLRYAHICESLLSDHVALLPSSIEHARFHCNTNSHHHRLVLFINVNYSLRSSLKQ